MFDKIVELFTQFFEFFLPFCVIDQYEEGVVLTCGKFRGRVLGPGFHWIWPFGIDKAMVDGVVTRTYNLFTTILETSDRRTVQIQVMIRYRIKDVVKALLEVERVEDAIKDISYGEIAKLIRQSAYDDINTDEWVELLYKKIRSRGHRYGLDVEEVQVTDLSATSIRDGVIRLIQSP